MKTKHTKELRNLKAKFAAIIFLTDFIAVLLIYFIMPLVQNFPPFSEDFGFQELVQPVTHIEQYSIVYIIGVTVHLLSFTILMQKIYKYLDKYYRNEKNIY